MIYCLSEISGAHINPAVSIGFFLTNDLNNKELLGFMSSQLLGALFASFTISCLFVSHDGLGTTLPLGGVPQSFLLECILSFFLMLVILGVSQNEKTRSYTPIAVGGIIFLEALFAGPIFGASMNPARSIAPALVSGDLTSLWIYIIAPIVGVIVAVVLWRILSR